MAEYIKREAVIDLITRRYENPEICTQEINSIPAADVALVVHGRWITNSDRPDTLICSNCNCGYDMWKHDPHNYCPNCGAKQDGGADDG